MTNLTPRIVMVVRDLNAVGGAQLNTLRLASKLCKIGFEIIFIGYGTKRSILAHIKKYSIDLDARIYSISPPEGLFRKISGYFPNFWFLLPCLFHLWRHRTEYDVIHGPLLMENGLIFGVATVLMGKPSLVKLGSGGRYGDVRRAVLDPIRCVRRFFYRYISMYICLTEEIEKEVSHNLHIPKNKLVRIKNGVDINVFHPVSREQKYRLRNRLGLKTSSKLVLFVGRLELKKRVDFLLKTWQSVIQKSGLDAHLIIVGDGSLRRVLESCRDQFNLGDHVTFFGNRENVAAFMQAADIFVMPSVSEGLANVFLEAMATALPIVATNTEGNSEILSHGGNAFLFQENNYKDLARYLILLMKNKNLGKKLGLCAQKIVEEHFSLQKTVLQYETLYRELFELSK